MINFSISLRFTLGKDDLYFLKTKSQLDIVCVTFNSSASRYFSLKQYWSLSNNGFNFTIAIIFENILEGMWPQMLILRLFLSITS